MFWIWIEGSVKGFAAEKQAELALRVDSTIKYDVAEKIFKNKGTTAIYKKKFLQRFLKGGCLLLTLSMSTFKLHTT